MRNPFTHVDCPALDKTPSEDDEVYEAAKILMESRQRVPMYDVSIRSEIINTECAQSYVRDSSPSTQPSVDTINDSDESFLGFLLSQPSFDIGF
jgi:hypothetical protein